MMTVGIFNFYIGGSVNEAAALGVILIVLGAAFQQVVFVDVAIVYALLSYVGALFIAKYLGGEL